MDKVLYIGLSVGDLVQGEIYTVNYYDNGWLALSTMEGHRVDDCPEEETISLLDLSCSAS